MYHSNLIGWCKSLNNTSSIDICTPLLAKVQAHCLCHQHCIVSPYHGPQHFLMGFTDVNLDSFLRKPACYVVDPCCRALCVSNRTSSSWDQIGHKGWFSPQIYTSKLSRILWVILVLDGRSFYWGHRRKSWCCSNVQGKSYGCNFWRQAISFCLIVLLFFFFLDYIYW